MSCFHRHLPQRDPLIFNALDNEKKRRQRQVELIASENSVSLTSRDAPGSVVINKTADGYPGNRFDGGADLAEVI